LSSVPGRSKAGQDALISIAMCGADPSTRARQLDRHVARRTHTVRARASTTRSATTHVVLCLRPRPVRARSTTRSRADNGYALASTCPGSTRSAPSAAAATTARPRGRARPARCSRASYRASRTWGSRPPTCGDAPRPAFFFSSCTLPRCVLQHESS